MHQTLAYPKRLLNADAQFGAGLDHPKTLDRLAVDLELDPLSRAVVEHPVTPDLTALRAVITTTEARDSRNFDACKWQCNGIGFFCFANPNDSLRLDRTELGYCPTIGALRHFHAVAYRFGLTTEQARELFDWPEGEESRGYDARLALLEKLDQFIVDHE